MSTIKHNIATLNLTVRLESLLRTSALIVEILSKHIYQASAAIFHSVNGNILQLLLVLSQYDNLAPREVQYSPSRMRDEFCTLRVAKSSY